MMKELVTKACNTLGLGLVESEVPTTKPGSRGSLFPEILQRALLYRDTKFRDNFNPYSIPFYREGPTTPNCLAACAHHHPQAPYTQSGQGIEGV